MKRLITAFILLIGISISSFAQNIKVRGTIVDEDGLPVIGAGVIVKGTTNGVVTNIDGCFEITCSPNATLAISAVGYEGKDIPVNRRTTINIVLNFDPNYPVFTGRTIIIAQSLSTPLSDERIIRMKEYSEAA